MGESDKGVDSVVDDLENLGLASEVTVVVGDDGEGTFKCERELLSRGCGYFKALFAFPGKKMGRVGDCDMLLAICIASCKIPVELTNS